MQSVLYTVPKTPEEWNWWSWSHRQSHHVIRSAISAQGGPYLPAYVLSPISEDEFPNFLEANSLSHFDMNGYLGVQGSDMRDVNVKDSKSLESWIFLHAQEHQTAETRLGVAS